MGQANYLEHIAKSGYFPREAIQQRPAEGARETDKRLFNCRIGYSIGRCGCGIYARSISCGKEWCKDCGRKESNTHLRRVARWWPKVHQMHAVGYWVFTFPPEWQLFWENREHLAKFSIALRRYFKENTNSKGLMRWHWAGSCKFCKGNKLPGNNGEGCEYCDYTGASRAFRPHINILVDTGHLPPALFKARKLAFQMFIMKWVYNNTKVDSSYCAIFPVVNYSYATEAAKKTHILKYVTRPTLRHVPSKTVYNIVHGFRASMTWGQWNRATDNKSPAFALAGGHCEKCKKTVQWEKIIKPEQFAARHVIIDDLGLGYFTVYPFGLRKEIIKLPLNLSFDSG